jgi:hypothetical protein
MASGNGSSQVTKEQATSQVEYECANIMSCEGIVMVGGHGRTAASAARSSEQADHQVWRRFSRSVVQLIARAVFV